MYTHFFAIQWHPEKDDTLQAFLDQWTDEALELINTPSPLTRQGLDNNARFRIVGDEDRVHEHRFCQLAVQLP
jgi:hypothetical protein